MAASRSSKSNCCLHQRQIECLLFWKCLFCEWTDWNWLQLFFTMDQLCLQIILIFTPLTSPSPSLGFIFLPLLFINLTFGLHHPAEPCMWKSQPPVSSSCWAAPHNPGSDFGCLLSNLSAPPPDGRSQRCTSPFPCCIVDLCCLMCLARRLSDKGLERNNPKSVKYFQENIGHIFYFTIKMVWCSRQSTDVSACLWLSEAKCTLTKLCWDASSISRVWICLDKSPISIWAPWRASVFCDTWTCTSAIWQGHGKTRKPTNKRTSCVRVYDYLFTDVCPTWFSCQRLRSPAFFSAIFS